MLLIGCDYHPSVQQIAFIDTETGECGEQRLPIATEKRRSFTGRTSRDVVDEATRVRPDLKVILTSPYSGEMVTANMSSPLIRGFIRKPFKLEDLLQTFRNVLSS